MRECYCPDIRVLFCLADAVSCSKEWADNTTGVRVSAPARVVRLATPLLARARYEQLPPLPQTRTRRPCSCAGLWGLGLAKKSVAIPGVACRQKLPAAREKGHATSAEGGACAATPPARRGALAPRAATMHLRRARGNDPVLHGNHHLTMLGSRLRSLQTLSLSLSRARAPLALSRSSRSLSLLSLSPLSLSPHCIQLREGDLLFNEWVAGGGACSQ